MPWGRCVTQSRVGRAYPSTDDAQLWLEYKTETQTAHCSEGQYYEIPFMHVLKPSKSATSVLLWSELNQFECCISHFMYVLFFSINCLLHSLRAIQHNQSFIIFLKSVIILSTKTKSTHKYHSVVFNFRFTYIKENLPVTGSKEMLEEVC